MGVKVSVIIFPSSKVELIFNAFPTSPILSDAVAQEYPQEFSDLLDDLESDDITDFEEDFNKEGSLVLESTTDSIKTGIVVFEPVTIY